jgi:hypothetical protein
VIRKLYFTRKTKQEKNQEEKQEKELRKRIK